MKKRCKQKPKIEKESVKIPINEFDSIVKTILQAPPEPPKKKPKKNHK